MTPFDLLNSVIRGSIHSETVSYRHDGASDPFDLSVIWEEGEDVEQRFPGVKALAWCLLSDFAAPPSKFDQITRSGRIYQVVENPEDSKDGAGGVTLRLRYYQDVIG